MILINDRVVGVIDEVSVANDKEVVRLEFRCKNQVTELFKLTDSTVFINYQNGSTKDRYAVADVTQDGEYVTFSWTLGANATKKQGKTFFVVCAVITEDEDVQQEWNTELAFFNVNKGLECETQPSEDMEDLFAQLTAMVEENASDISDLEGSKQDKLIAGDNITIQGNVISASSSVDAYTKSETDALLDEKQNVLTAGAGISISDNVISATAGINIEVVQALPSTGDTQTIYLVPNNGSAPNIYDEYIYVNNAWEKIGTTEVDLSNYYTKTETNTLLSGKADTSALASKLDANQGSANVGKVMIVGADGELSPEALSGGGFTPTQFVDSLPLSNIDTNSNYAVLASKLFPDATSYTDSTYPVSYVTYTETNGFRLCVINSANLFDLFDGWSLNRNFKIYQVVDGEWSLLYEEQSSNRWGDYMSTPYSSNLDVVVSANNHLRTNYDGRIVYDTSNNKADITGVVVNPEDKNNYLWDFYKYEDNDWTYLGRNNFYALFDKNLENLENTVNTKLDKNQNSTNAGKFMKVGSDGNLVPDTITVPTYTAGQNITISAQNVISAGIEVIEI